MGKATNEARHTLWLYPNQQRMQAVLIVKDPSNNGYFQAHASYSDGTGREHVEQMLMQMLYQRYNGFKDIPNDATIIFACKWSPCKECTGFLIPDFMKRISYGQKGLRVKFRFDKFYAKGPWTDDGGTTDGQTLWPDEGTARVAYKQLCKDYGNHSIVDVGATQVDGITMMTTKFKPHLAIAPASDDRTSAIHTYSIS